MDAGEGACHAQRQRGDSAEKEARTFCRDGFAWSHHGSGTLPESPLPQGLQIRSLMIRDDKG